MTIYRRKNPKSTFLKLWKHVLRTNKENQRWMYVDDLVNGGKSLQEVQKMKSDLIGLFEKGGNLANFGGMGLSG